MMMMMMMTMWVGMRKWWWLWWWWEEEKEEEQLTITNTSKPDIRQGTRTQTKDATDLLRSKDDIRDGSTIFQDKRWGRIIVFLGRIAIHSTVKLPHFEVIGPFDHFRGAESCVSRGFGNGDLGITELCHCEGVEKGPETGHFEWRKRGSWCWFFCCCCWFVFFVGLFFFSSSRIYLWWSSTQSERERAREGERWGEVWLRKGLWQVHSYNPNILDLHVSGMVNCNTGRTRL